VAVKLNISYDVLASGAVRGRMTNDGQKYSYTSKEKVSKGTAKEDIPDSIKKEILKEIENQYNTYIRKGAPSKTMKCEDWCEYWLTKYKRPLKANEKEEGEKIENKNGGRVTMPSYNRLWQTFNMIKSTESGRQTFRKKLKDITRDNIEDILLELEEKGLSNSSLKKVKNFFGASFDKAVVRGYLVNNPCLGIKIQEDKKIKNEELTDFIPARYFESVVKEALRKNEDGSYVHEYGAGVVIQLLTGCRCGEIRALDWEDVSDDEIFIRHSVSLVNDLDEDGKPVKGKQHVFLSNTKNSGSIRHIPFEKGDVIDECFKILRQRFDDKVRNSSGNERSLVLSTSSGWYLTIGNYNKCVKKIVEAAIPESDVSSHKLRHSFISLLVNDKKAEIPAVARIVGHKNTRVTYLYANHTEDEKKRKVLGLATSLVQGVLADEPADESDMEAVITEPEFRCK
jgi:integrase